MAGATEAMEKVPLVQGQEESCLRKNTFCILLVCILVLVLTAAIFSLYWAFSRDYAGAIASSNPYASKVGWEVLQQGGNAVDAMVAMQLVLSLTEPPSSGIGGGCFIMYYSNSEDKVHAIDGREEVSSGSGYTIPTLGIGGAGVGVPGCVHAMMRALNQFGTWDFARCAAPAIAMARSGFVIGGWLAHQFEQYKADLLPFNSSVNLFFDYVNGTWVTKPAGSVLKNPDYADTLEIMAQKGWQDFYTGEIARSIINAIRNDTVNPGVMSLEDLANYMSVERQPVNSTWNNLTFVGMNMPTSGNTILFQILNILEALALKNYSEEEDYASLLGEWGSIQYILAQSSISNLGYADRLNWTADADFVDVPVEELIDKEYAKIRSELFVAGEFLNRVEPGRPWGLPYLFIVDSLTEDEGEDTTHFSIIDQFQNVVSCTSSLQENFGSGLVVPGRGFLLNNQITDFGNQGPNAITPERKFRRTALPPEDKSIGGKRPRSSMSPTIIFKDNQPFMALGSPGGPSIIGAVFSVLANIFIFDMDLQSAVNAPRVISRNDGLLRMEDFFYSNETLRSALSLAGVPEFYNLSEYSAGSVAVVKLENGKYSAAADPRKQGQSFSADKF